MTAAAVEEARRQTTRLAHFILVRSQVEKALLEVRAAPSKVGPRSRYAHLPADERAMREEWDEQTRELADQQRRDPPIRRDPC